MPELPEVETVCRGLKPVVQGKKIIKLVHSNKGLRQPFPPDLENVAQHKIIAIRRRAKYVVMDMDDGRSLLLHLGMSGRLLIYPAGETPAPQKHDHLRLTLANGVCVVLNDPRRFGLVALAETRTLENHPLLAHLGPEPLEKAFDAPRLAKTLRTRRSAIKLAIMDQEVVVGVGNIYASEALFQAGIDPRRPACDITTGETRKLVAAIKNVLHEAIEAGGSSLKDYVQTNGELGYFQHRFAVYGREGQACRGCRCAQRQHVQRLVQGGRSTFYCPVRQK